jgi:hypothetical protein
VIREREVALLRWLFLNDYGNAPVLPYEHNGCIELVSIEPEETDRLRAFVRDYPPPAELPRIVVGTFGDMARWPREVVDGLLANLESYRAS